MQALDIVRIVLLSPFLLSIWESTGCRCFWQPWCGWAYTLRWNLYLEFWAKLIFLRPRPSAVNLVLNKDTKVVSIKSGQFWDCYIRDTAVLGASASSPPGSANVSPESQCLRVAQNLTTWIREAILCWMLWLRDQATFTPSPLTTSSAPQGSKEYFSSAPGEMPLFSSLSPFGFGLIRSVCACRQALMLQWCWNLLS